MKPGWKLLTHDVGFLDENLNEILEKLRETINVKVEPLQIKVWEKLFKKWGFSEVKVKYWPMSLMSPIWMIRDEWLFNTIKIIRNWMKKENREMFKNMRTFFNKIGKDLKYIAVCSTKKR